MILDSIILQKLKEIAKRKKILPLASLKNLCQKSRINFKKAISQPGLACIAEIKKLSPSSGILNKQYNLKKIISIYNCHPAVKAISVLTDQKFFGMSPSDLTEARKLTNKPLLRKEFIIDPYQIYETRHLGANAFLLIASQLNKKQLNQFITLGSKLGMHALVEVHTKKELEMVLKTKAEIIGINNRNLDTLKIDLDTTKKLAKVIPNNRIIVSESGYTSEDEIQNIKQDVDAILIGTTLLKQKNIYQKITQLFQK